MKSIECNNFIYLKKFIYLKVNIYFEIFSN